MKNDIIGPILFLMVIIIGPVFEALKILILLPFIILWAIAWSVTSTKSV